MSSPYPPALQESIPLCPAGFREQGVFLAESRHNHFLWGGDATEHS